VTTMFISSGEYIFSISSGAADRTES